jgi:hypothetical protein
MPLDFIRTRVEPGDPVTADAWNAIVDGLFEAQAVLKAAGGTARVLLTGAGLDPATARVTAARTGAPPAEAVRPTGDDPHFVFPRLAEGAYAVRAEAPGFTPAQGALTVAANGAVTPDPLQLALVLARGRMPNVLGLPLPQAVQQLGAVKLRILDAAGASLPATGFAAEYNGKPVLMQWPLPGDLVPAAGVDAQLVVAAPAAAPAVELVEVPSVLGMTEQVARATLANAGLQVVVAGSGGASTM